MDEQIGRLEKRVVRQDERIAQLERRVGRSSRNSSRPPSSDPPSMAPKRGKDRSRRKQGAQHGHGGKGRPLLAAWAVEEVVEYWPTECDCGHAFAETERVAVGQPTRHHVEELPVIAVTVTEHRCQRVRCPGCAATVTAVVPSEVVFSAFGRRLQAAIVTLSIRNRISRRDVVELCEQLFSSRISTGTIDAILTRAGDALAEPYADLLDRVRAADTLNIDETGWRLKGAQRALWGAFTDPSRRLRDRTEPSRRSRPRSARRHEGGRDIRSLVGLRAPAAQAPPGLLVTSTARLRRARRRPRGRKDLGEAGLRTCEQLFWAWEIYQHTGDRADLKAPHPQAAPRTKSRSSSATPARPRATAPADASRATC
jgi:hypothetical protein